MHLVIFLPKLEGALRPIGLTISLLRVWSRMRHAEALKWERVHAAPFFWGGKGFSCDNAGWTHNLRVGWGALRKLEVGSVFLDIEKFYENVSLQVLLQEAMAMRFPPRLLKALLATYSGPRVVWYDGAVSKTEQVTRTEGGRSMELDDFHIF